MNTRARRIAAVLGAVAILAIVAVPVIEAQTDYRFPFPVGVRTTNTGASLFVRQDGSGSVATFRDGATDEFTIDQAGTTGINPLTLNGTGNVNGAQLDIKAAPTQATPPFLVRSSDGTPVASISNAGALVVAGITDATGGVTAAEIADVVRYINMPLASFFECQTDAAALIGFDTTADALPDFVNSATDGTGFVIRFDDTGSSEDQTTEICSQLTVPADFASGGAFRVRALKDAHTAATEVLNCAVSVNGAALEVAGTTTTTASATTSYACTPTIAALAANDSLSFYLSITSDSTMNDLVDIAAVSFFYTATQ